MKYAKTIKEYLGLHPEWSGALDKLRRILRSTELEESIKWGGPCYTIDGKNVVGLGAFKSHVALWFHQGVFLEDPDKVLVNAQEGTTKALRQWRFSGPKEIKAKSIKPYLLEAIENQRAGKVIKPTRKQKLALPPQLSAALNKHKSTKAAFEKLTPGRQREYAEFLVAAKREATKFTRLEKILPLIKAGAGLHDKYRNC